MIENHTKNIIGQIIIGQNCSKLIYKLEKILRVKVKQSYTYILIYNVHLSKKAWNVCIGFIIIYFFSKDILFRAVQVIRKFHIASISITNRTQMVLDAC